MHKIAFRLVVGLLALGFLNRLPTGCAMIINGGTEATNNRLYVGADRDFFGDPYDWSGVGRRRFFTDDISFATMISPSYFLTATHWAARNTVRFYPENDPGVFYEYTVASGGTQILDPISGQGTDLYLRRLESPIPTTHQIAQYPILRYIDYPSNLLDLSAYLGLSFFMYGGSPAGDNDDGHYVGANVIDALGYVSGYSTFMSYFPYDSPGLPYEAWGQGGDSAGPSLAAIEADLAVIGIHYLISTEPSATFDSFVPYYYDQIVTAMANDPNNVNDERPTALIVYTNIPIIPEPATVLLLAAALLLPHRRRSARSRQEFRLQAVFR